MGGLLLDLPVLPFALAMRIAGRVAPNDDLFANLRTGDRPRVVLVHGSGSNSYQWLWTGLLYLGDFDLYTVNLRERDSLSQSAQQVRNLLNQLQNKSPASISLIGCSMGGLVAAHAAETTNVSVSAVVTIGSPFQGAPALKKIRFNERRYADMAEGSNFLALLNGMIKFNIERCDRYLFYGGELDLMVPDEYAYPANMHMHHMTHPFGHWSPMLLPNIWGNIRNHILWRYEKNEQNPKHD